MRIQFCLKNYSKIVGKARLRCHFDFEQRHPEKTNSLVKKLHSYVICDKHRVFNCLFYCLSISIKIAFIFYSRLK